MPPLCHAAVRLFISKQNQNLFLVGGAYVLAETIIQTFKVCHINERRSYSLWAAFFLREYLICKKRR